MLKYHGSHLTRMGLIGVLVVAFIVAIGLQPEQLIQWATCVRYQARFAEAGGLSTGADVTLSGIKVGSVTDVALDDGDALVTFTLAGKYGLGEQTTAHIRTGSLLGERVLTVEPAGSGKMRPLEAIPLTRTSSPYSLVDVVGELTTNTSGTDTESLNRSLDTLSDTIDQIAPQLGPTFDGLSRLSRAVNSRDEGLADLLKSAADLTGVLSERSQQINSLILDADSLVDVLNTRRQAIVNLLVSTSAVSRQLSELVAQNNEQLKPTLQKVIELNKILEKNRDNLAKALPGLAKYELTQGETVSNGFYYSAYVPNLFLPQLLQPFFDYAFGFRRGVDAGQPPDNAGPRAELPFPVNGIPQPGDLPPR